MGARAAVSRWRAALDARAAAWVRRRQGQDALPVRLERRRLYILPTRAGLGFCVLLLAMLLAGLNYSNSLALLVTFALGGFAIVGMTQCHRNLLGLQLVALQSEAAFAGESARLTLALENPGTERYDVAAEALGATSRAPCAPPAAVTRLDLRIPARQRGRLRSSRLRLTTAFPFGLFRCWTWVHLPLEVIVYPRPLGSRPPPSGPAGRDHGSARHDAGRDELRDLRPFRDGDSPRQVAWKAYARGMPLLVKEYSGATAEAAVFDFAALADLELEARLSQLCRWLLDAEARGGRYALRLPTLRIDADRGPTHLARCLQALALYDPPGAVAATRSTAGDASAWQDLPHG